ncbi:MAG: DUF2723 domain-containing protein [Kiritimatiellia bacterium]|jgi:hypothetical protein
MTEIDLNAGLSSTKPGAFFRRLDWSSFWTGAVLSFIVYFLTAAPSVTLEDAGELAVAGDYLGVPHPPGYPIWTMCAWVFSRVLGFVTFRGQPNPAWAIAVMSGFFGAIACGLTAMLVTRTSADILRSREEAAGRPANQDGLMDLICWTAGVASSLVFAFSPVMWSQATIVEVYTLNALFLMLIYVLTYRWMCRPSEKVLWITAFVFGLGLTNYQVLLLAMIPLVIVIMLQDVELFRDFVLVAIPFGLTAGVMKLGAQVSRPGFPKHKLLQPDVITSSGVVPSSYYIAAIVFGALFVLAAAFLGWQARNRERLEKEEAYSTMRVGAFGALALSALALLVVCASVPAAPTPGEWAFAQPKDMFSWALPTLALLGGIAMLFVFSLFTPAGLWYAIAVTGIQIAMAVFLRKGALLGLTHPLSGAFAFYVVLNFVFTGLAWLLLPHGRTVSLTVFAAELGVAFYGYMPISSDTNPPMNWGYPRTWEGFKHAISRGQYEKITPTTMFSPVFVKQLGAYFADMRMQFTLILAPLGFLPFAVWRVKARDVKLSITKPMVWLVGAVAALVAADKVFDFIDLKDLRIDKFLVGILLLAALAGAHAILVSQIVTLVRKALDRAAPNSTRLIAGLSGLGVALAVVLLAMGFCNAGAETALEMMGIHAPEKMTGLYAFQSYGLSFLLFAIWLAGVGFLSAAIWTRSDVFTLEIGDVSQRWHIATMSGFLMMSLVLIALANPKYDIQDNFIQKVKFISSHGIFAIWIGYGIAYALAEFRHHRTLCLGLVCAALLTPLIPIHENYFNEHLVDTMSGAEQDGRDFGWQFGNYQLRGAEAIIEELDDDEEPLPNPTYPPAMTTNAVFYGGTDPGRFVPTYMIYSAKVRPDVFLITQNALADNTYLDTMRFLYADQIWMPTLDDNSKAFQTYVEDVQAGRRPDYGGISYEGGRVQVNGALAVMEINGIITEQIFKKNRALHDFYVEESYAIRWMYPHLTPHGLIMKINDEPVNYSPQTVRDDMDFWDWYARRLLSHPKYPRDFVARKTFSKLRGAIAGTYSQRRMLEQAERGFQEARMLYVYSPEATLRLIQEVLLPQRRVDESLQILALLQGLDPNNTKLPINEIKALKQAMDDAGHLMSRKLMEGGLPDDETLALASAQATLGQIRQAAQTIGERLQKPGVTPEFALKAGLLLQAHGQASEAAELFKTIPPARFRETNFISNGDLRKVYETCMLARDVQGVVVALSAYLQRVPSDWRARIDSAMIWIGRGNREQAKIAIDLAIKHGGHEAEQMISQVPQLSELREKRGFGTGFGGRRQPAQPGRPAPRGR